MIYFDATFLVRLYVEEPGYQTIRELAGRADAVKSSIIGKMETEAAFHRKFREGTLDQKVLSDANKQLVDDHRYELIIWLPLSPSIVETVHHVFLNLDANVFLRTGDAIHLATAAEAGFKEIYSNDRHLLAAATLFKLKGINPLAK